MIQTELVAALEEVFAVSGPLAKVTLRRYRRSFGDLEGGVERVPAGPPVIVTGVIARRHAGTEHETLTVLVKGADLHSTESPSDILDGDVTVEIRGVEHQILRWEVLGPDHDEPVAYMGFVGSGGRDGE